MFGKLFKRIGVATSGITGSVLEANEVTVMEGMVATMVYVAYANGVCEDAEVDVANKLMAANPQLREFGSEPVHLFDKYCDQMEASMIQGKLDMMERIEKLSGDEDNSKRLLVAGIEIAAACADEEGADKISKDEEDALGKIARALDLRLGQYI